MPTPVFATPDFGAGAGAACIILVLFLVGAAIAAGLVTGVCWGIYRIRNPKWRWIAALSFATAVVVICFCVWLYDFKPYADFGRLLAGSKDVRIERMEFDGQRGQVVLTDPAATEYLTEGICSAKRNEFKAGITYDARIYLSTGNSVACFVYIPDDKGYLTIRFPVETIAEGSYYLVQLPEPKPDSLSQAIAKLK